MSEETAQEIHIAFITSNANKLREVQAILNSPSSQTQPQAQPQPQQQQQQQQRPQQRPQPPPPVTINLTNADLPVPEIQAGTIEEICRDKCRRAREMVRGPVLVEDTALSFTALGGLPGAYIKWFLSALGHEGLNNLLAAYEDKSAEAICTFAYSAGPPTTRLIRAEKKGDGPAKDHEEEEDDDDGIVLFQGKTRGKVVSPRGPNTFGWDPIFEYQGKTYAEMTGDEKNTVSHRYKALAKMRDYFLARS